MVGNRGMYIAVYSLFVFRHRATRVLLCLRWSSIAPNLFMKLFSGFLAIYSRGI